VRLDAHQHFWALARGDYGWLTPELETLYRDFQPSDLSPLLQAESVEGTILVQAAPTLAETEYMLDLAASHEFIKGVVGWVDFAGESVRDQIAGLAKNPKLVGLRPMIQDIKDDDWMLRDDLSPAFKSLIAHDLTFDALTFPRHLKNLRELLIRFPGLRVVIDHGSKPNIAEKEFQPWADDMAALGAETCAFVKLSGLVTEAGADWTVDDLRPFVDHLLEHFGATRMIWGSDWPVCTLASTYQDWCRATDQLLAALDDIARSAVLGRNAVRAYRLAGE